LVRLLLVGYGILNAKSDTRKKETCRTKERDDKTLNEHPDKIHAARFQTLDREYADRREEDRTTKVDGKRSL